MFFDYNSITFFTTFRVNQTTFILFLKIWCRRLSKLLFFATTYGTCARTNISLGKRLRGGDVITGATSRQTVKSMRESTQELGSVSKVTVADLRVTSWYLGSSNITVVAAYDFQICYYHDYKHNHDFYENYWLFLVVIVLFNVAFIFQYNLHNGTYEWWRFAPDRR